MRSIRLAVVVALAVVAGTLWSPVVANADPIGQYWIWTDPGYLSTGVQGQVYHYGTFPITTGEVRSLYLQKTKNGFGTYIEVGQIYSYGYWTPTKHFWAYEDYGYTTYQQQYTYGNCASATWYNYYIYREASTYPSYSKYYMGRTGDSFAWVLLFDMMDSGYPESSMEHHDPTPTDNAYGSYTALSRRKTSPLSWISWERMYDPNDESDGYDHQYDSGATYTRRSSSSWYSSYQ